MSRPSARPARPRELNFTITEDGPGQFMITRTHRDKGGEVKKVPPAQGEGPHDKQRAHAYAHDFHDDLVHWIIGRTPGWGE